MAGDERLGASFSIDTTNLKAGLATANRLIRESESEFRAAAAGMDDWTKSEEGLTKRQKALSDQIDIQKEKISALTREKQKIIDKMKAEGKSQEEIDRAIDGTNKQITAESKQLDKLKSELDKTNKALDAMSDETDDAADALEDASDAAKDAGDGFTIAKGAISDLIANGVSALVGACKNAISSLANLAEETRESRTAFAKLEQAFDTAGFSAETAEKTMSDLYGVLGDQDKATEASSLIVKMSKDQEDLEKNTRILTGVFAEYGDSIPTEGLAEAMAASSEMSSVQGVLADALEWQGINLDDYNEKLGKMSSSEERASYIQETLTKLYGKSADAFRENNKDLIDANEAQLDYQESLNEIGERIEPITTKIKNGFGKILEKVLELTEDVDLEAFGDKIDKAFDTFLNDVMPKILDGLTWIKDNKDILIAAITGIGTAFLVFKIGSLIQTVTAALEGMTVAQWLLNAAMNANPIGLIALAIGALIAAIVLLIKNWDSVKEAALICWDAIKEAAGAVADWFKETWDTISKLFSNMWAGLKNKAKDAWTGIKNVFAPVADWFNDKFSKAWEKVKGVFSTGGKIFDGIKDGIESAFKTVVNGIIRGINKVVASPFNAINTTLDKIRDVSIAGIQPFSGLISRFTVPQIPELAKGGVVRGATTAVIGEDGAEAIVPLEKNRQWIKAVAEELAAINKQGVVVNQTNNYSAAHSRLELYKTKQQTAAAVRLAMGV